MSWKTWFVAAAACAASGCAVGPDFVRPQSPAVTRYVPEALAAPSTSVPPGPTAALVQPDPGMDVPQRWWSLFGNAQLDALVDQALATHPSVAAAKAALRAAHELRVAQQGAYFPGAQLGLSTTRQRVGPVLSSPLASNATLFRLDTSQVSVGFVPDLFGANRRQVESLAAQEEGQHFELEAARQALAANLVSAAIQEAALRAQIEATLPPLSRQLALQRDLIAQLSGRLPVDMPSATFAFDGLQLPQRLPLALPSVLVEHRPDVRSAQAQWHAANAQIGVATAAMLPQVSLTADYGGAGTLSVLPSAAKAFWSLGAGLTQPLFQGGTLLHRRAAAVALADAAAAQYRLTVLSAFQGVADALQALDADREGLDVAGRAEAAARRSLDIARNQVRLGDASELSMLLAQQTWQQAVAAQVQARSSLLTDVAALCLALGGGWWQAPDRAG